MRLSEDEYSALLKRRHVRQVGSSGTRPGVPDQPQASSEPAPPHYRSKTEARFAEILRWRQACGEIDTWWYEPCSLRLGVRCHYLPDFLVCLATDRALEFYEVKGAYIPDHALIKVRAAATRYPCFRFRVAQWRQQQWRFSEVRTHG